MIAPYPDPTKGISRDDLKSVGTENILGQMRKDPPVLYGIFTELTRQIYKADLGSGSEWVWDEDLNKTKIWIDTEYQWNDKTVELRPAIFIALSRVDFGSYVGDTKGVIGRTLEEGITQYGRSGKGSVSWVHIGHTHAEAVRIATDTLQYVDAFSNVIREDFCFERFYVTSIDTAQVVKEARERMRTTVTAQFEFQETWQLKLESPKLRVIAFNAGQRVLDLIGS